MDAWQVPLDHTSRPIDRSALYFCGFPTLQHIRHKVGICLRVPVVYWFLMAGSRLNGLSPYTGSDADPNYTLRSSPKKDSPQTSVQISWSSSLIALCKLLGSRISKNDNKDRNSNENYSFLSFLSLSLSLCLVHGLPHFKFYKKKCGVLVFQQASRGENMILDIIPSQEGEAVSFRLFLLLSLDKNTENI